MMAVSTIYCSCVSPELSLHLDLMFSMSTVDYLMYIFVRPGLFRDDAICHIHE